MKYESINKFILSNVSSYINEKINSSLLSKINYVSTESMLSNKNGIVKAESIPNGNVNRFKKNDILISNIRPYFKKIWHADKDGGCSADVLILRNKENINSKFLYYLLMNDYFFEYIMKGSKGTKMPRGDKSHIMNFPIIMPSLKKQIEIANILSSLDDKIELNNKINKNLEELAQTLYKRWFIDFEFPNENGEPYKSSGGLMIESELGMIPENWTILVLEDRFEFERGIEPGSKNYSEDKNQDSIAFYRVGDLNQKSNVFVDKKLIKNKLVSKQEVLVSFDGAIGRVGIGFEGSYSTGLRKVYDKSENISSSLIYMIMKSDNIQETIKAHANGTTILHAGSAIQFLKIAFNERVFIKFQELINPIFYKFIQIIHENKTLMNLRDELLPKLMSGEIEVPIKE